MKRALLCLMAMFVFSSMSFAQTPSSTSTDTKPAHKSGMKGMKHGMKGEKTLTGCVSQEAGSNEFMLKSGAKRNIELESAEDLKAHVGHTVKVKGTWDMEGDKSEMAGGADAMGHKDMDKKEGMEHKGMKEHHFKVSSLEMVSDSCKMGATKAKARSKKPSPSTGN